MVDFKKLVKPKISLPVVKSTGFAAKVRGKETGIVLASDTGDVVEAEVVSVPETAYSDDWDIHDLGCLQTRPPSMITAIQQVLDSKRKDPPYFRPSGFGGCRRSQIFFYCKEHQEPSQPDDTLSMILETGTALHPMVQKWLASHPGIFFTPEVPVWNPELEIRGSSDGLCSFRTADKYGSTYRWGFELKTIGPAGFEALTKPKPEHVVQASIYAKLMGVWWITIVYYCKGTSKLKEFHVQFDPNVWEQVKARVAELKEHINAGTLPEFDAKECRNSINLCHYVRRCYEIEGKAPPMTWGGNQ